MILIIIFHYMTSTYYSILHYIIFLGNTKAPKRPPFRVKLCYIIG